MKTMKVFSTFLIAAVLIALSAPGIALAGAYEATWASTIAYQNIGSGEANVYIAFYTGPSDTSPDTYPAGTIAKDASKVIIVGSMIGGTFKGAAVLSADQPLTAVIQQITGDTTVRVRPLSNGFSSGTTSTFIPSVFKLNAAVTQFSVQNVGPGQATVDVRFLNADGTLKYNYSQVIEAGAGHYVDPMTIAAITLEWQGTVEVKRTAGTGLLISSVLETNTNGSTQPWKANAFEGIGTSSAIYYMPTAQCKTGTGANLTNSAFALMNPSSTVGDNATVTVTFKWENSTTTVKTVTLTPLQKMAVSGCAFDAGYSEPTGLNGAAIIQSTRPIMATGKLFNPSFQTAYNGIPVGYSKISLPLVRWADATYYPTGNYQRTFISILNVSGFTLNANEVVVKYIDRNGATLATFPIPLSFLDGQKRATNPSSAGLTIFGYYNNYTESGGGAIVECLVAGCKLALTARLQNYVTSTTQAAEDYIGLPYNP